MTRDGQSAATANLPMGGFTLSGLGAGALAGQALAYGQAAASLSSLEVTTLLTLPGTTTAVGGAVDLTGGTVTVATQTAGDSTAKAASTAFVSTAITSLPGGSLPALAGQAGQALVVNPDEATVSWEKRYQGDLIGESITSMVISVATGKVFTVPSGKSWAAAQEVIVYYDASNYMKCTVVSYSGTTLTLDCTVITGSGTYAVWVIYPSPGLQLKSIPIFSAEAATSDSASNFESLANVLSPVSLAPTQFCFGNSLFVGGGGVSSANVVSSPDAITWTLRAMPSAAVWLPATNGSDKWIATVSASTTLASSTNGTVWAAATALPAASKSSIGSPVFNGNTCLVLSSIASTAYTSTDNGATWGTQTLPSTTGSVRPFALDGLFWYYNGTTVAYTSATGATGSWTVRALPITPGSGMIWRDLNGALLMRAAEDTISNLYRTTDGINWTDLGFAGPDTSSRQILSFNGVWMQFSNIFGATFTRHNGVWVSRGGSLISTNSSQLVSNVAHTIFAVPVSGGVGQIEPAAASASTALFVR